MKTSALWLAARFSLGVATAWLAGAVAARAATYQVGPTRSYTTVGSLPALSPGDVVEIDSATYHEVKRWTTSGTAVNPITIRGIGVTRPVFDAAGLNVSGSLPNPRAVFQVEGSYTVLQNLEFRNATNGNNGAGIRVTSANNVTVSNCRITACDMGFMSDACTNLVIETSEIGSNGTALADGYSHNLYLSGYSATIRFCYIHDALNGQNFKTRGHYTELLYNYIADSQDGEVGLVDAAATADANSHAVMIGNIVISKSRLSAYNTSRFIQFGQDSGGAHNGTLFAFNNTFIAGDNRIKFLSANATGSTLIADNNVFHGSDQIVGTSGDGATGANNWMPTTATVPAGFTGSVLGSDPGFVDRANRNLLLNATSGCRNQGLGSFTFLDGAGISQSGVPSFEYVNHQQCRARPTDATLDLGAYEYAASLTQLQLLMPGETAAPGTPAGKTGTPTAQTVGTAFNVTVNAVDGNWNVVSTNHTVGITSSDSRATLPSNAALVGGTATFSVTLNTAGTATVTATDITDGTKPAHTSPSTTVNPRAVTISSGLTGNTKVYDGRTTATISSNSVVLVGVLAADTANVSLSTNSYSAAFSSATVGSGKTLTVSGLALTGSAAANYTLSAPSLTANITAKALTAAGTLAAQNKTYDATTGATLTGAAALLTAEAPGAGTTSDNKPYTGDTVSVTGTPSGTFASKNVANGIAVSVAGLSLSGAQAGNYSLTAPSLTANITAKALTAAGTLAAQNKTYDATTGATLTGAAALLTAEAPGAGTTSDNKPYTGDTVSVTGTPSGTFASKNAANGIAVSVAGLSLSGAQAANYSLTAPSLTANVTAKALTVQGITAGSTVYDGTTAAKLGGTASLLTAEAPGAGSTADGKPYTGDTVTLSGTPAGTLAAKDVGVQAVTITGNTISGAQAGNYTLTQQTGLTQTVAPKALTAAGTLAAQNKAYDATTTATLTGAAALLTAEAPGAGTTSDNKPYTGDTVSVTGTPSGTFASKNAANGIAVSVAGLSLSGAQAGNYSLTSPSLTANITKADQLITFGAIPDQLTTSTVALQATASSGLPVAFAVSSGPASIAQGTNLSFTAAGSVTLTASQAGDANWNAAPDVSRSFNVNSLPVPSSPALERWPLGGVKVRAANLLGTDPDGDSISLAAAGPGSTHGGTVSTNATWVFYTPAAGFTNADSFGYTVRDSRGGTNNGTVMVALTTNADPTPNYTVEDLGGGFVRLNFSGIPGRTYTTQFSDTLAPANWQTLATRTAGVLGEFTCTDRPPGDPGTRFYRTLQTLP
jgi:hypothetical protein